MRGRVGWREGGRAEEGELGIRGSEKSGGEKGGSKGNSQDMAFRRLMSLRGEVEEEVEKFLRKKEGDAGGSELNQRRSSVFSTLGDPSFSCSLQTTSIDKGPQPLTSLYSMSAS